MRLRVAVDRIINNLPHISAQMDAVIKEATVTSANNIRDRVITNMQMSDGRPGWYPRTRSGHFIRWIRIVGSSARGKEAVVVFDARHAPYLQRGTSVMPARPYATLARDEEEPIFLANVAEGLARLY